MNVMNYTFPSIRVLICVFYHFSHSLFEVLIFFLKLYDKKKKKNKFSLRLYQVVLKKIMWTLHACYPLVSSLQAALLRDGFKRSLKGAGRRKWIIEF